MGLVVDSSTPARWTGTPADGVNLTSASFTAPSGALLVLTAEWDSNTSVTLTSDCNLTVSDSGSLAWTQKTGSAATDTPKGGASGIWTAVTTSAVSRTVSVSRNNNGSSNRISCKLLVFTGQDTTTPVDTTGASNHGTSTTNDMTTTSVTPGADGMLVVADTEWNQLGLETSSDLTYNASPNADGAADYAGQIDAFTGYKTVTNGVAAHGDINAGGTAAAQHKWCQVVVRASSVVFPGDEEEGLRYLTRIIW